MSEIYGSVSGMAAAAMQQAEQAKNLQQQAAPEVPFSGVVQSMMADSTNLEQKASDAVMGLMNGTGVELHEAMIATQKADMSFELALQIRNKAVAAYQQMMNMQF